MNERVCVRVGALARGRQRSNRSRPPGFAGYHIRGPLIRSEMDKPEPAGRRQWPFTGFSSPGENMDVVEKRGTADPVKATVWEREEEEI